jgi:signal transduction histidine kinase
MSARSELASPAVANSRGGVRLRLTALYSGLFVAAGAGLLALTYLLVAHFPVTEDTHLTIRPGSASTVEPDALPALAAGQRAADLHRLLLLSTVALVVMAVVAVGLGWLVAGRVLRPLRMITAATRRISASNLHQRLDRPGPADELKELGDTIDGLLARLEHAFTAQRQFVANASHELRTPVTLQCALLEEALTDPDPTPASWRHAAERALAAGVQQARLIDALLTLARGESLAHNGTGAGTPVDLAAITADLLRTRRTGTGRRELTVTADLGPARLTGDARLIELLAANLIDNAIRHNHNGGRITVATSTQDGQARLSVRNTGPTVPAGELARLFEPFQRLGQARTHEARTGSGLGLAIVRAVATAHRADLVAHPGSGGGLDITVTFPAVPAGVSPGPARPAGPGPP